MKTKIRNISLFILALVMAVSLALAFAGCGDDDSTKGADYTITFNENYSGGNKTKVGVYGGEFDMPTSPTREGYMFSGWYADKDCTEDVDFDSITKNTTVYAGWIERTEGMVYITYDYNLNGMGTYKVQEVESNTMVSSLDSSCSVSGYKFIGWYTEAACENEYVLGLSRINDDITLYAYWYKGYTFEAEYTDLADPNDDDEIRAFQGYSQNATPIYASSGASNGYYVADMYIKEAYIYFDIESTADVEDAILSLRVALDYGWGNDGSTSSVTITSDQYTLTVNGVKYSYSTMTFTGVSNLKSGQTTNFQLLELCHISLKEGSNTIRLEVTNDYGGQGGTQDAIAPIVDYMMIYVPQSVELSWDPCTDNVTKWGTAQTQS